jgi:hypothetical protein
MHFGPRLMRRSPESPESGDERAELQRVLASCPGVLLVHSIEAHRKGGYVAVMEFHKDQLDQYIEHMERHGWMNVF